MKVSIIITTFNRAEFLEKTLESMGDINVPEGYEVELVIVDNASTDRTAEIVHNFIPKNIPIIYVYESKKGQSNARNTGMKVATGSIFLWTDDDMKLPNDWIISMCEPIRQGQADGVGGRIKLAPSVDREWLRPELYWRLADTRFMKEDLGFMIGANMAFSRDVLKKIPQFDPQLGPGALGFADDTLFSFQMIEAGFKLLTSPTTVEHHIDSSRLLRKSWLRHGDANGKSAAYAHYHWYHQGVSMPKLKLLGKKAILFLHRLTSKRYSEDTEGCDEKEMLLVESASFLDYYIKQQSLPRRYSLKGFNLNSN